MWQEGQSKEMNSQRQQETKSNLEVTKSSSPCLETFWEERSRSITSINIFFQMQGQVFATNWKVDMMLHCLKVTFAGNFLLYIPIVSVQPSPILPVRMYSLMTFSSSFDFHLVISGRNLMDARDLLTFIVYFADLS